MSESPTALVHLLHSVWARGDGEYECRTGRTDISCAYIEAGYADNVSIEYER